MLKSMVDPASLGWVIAVLAVTIAGCAVLALAVGPYTLLFLPPVIYAVVALVVACR